MHQVAAQQRIQQRLHLVHVRHDQRLAKAHRQLQRVGKPRVVHGGDLDGRGPGVAGCLGEVRLEPIAGGFAGVDDERAGGGGQDGDAVLHAEVVARQPLPLPREHLALAAHEAFEIVGGRHRQQHRPARLHLGAHVLRYARQVRHKRAGHEARERQVRDGGVQCAHRLHPPPLLARQLAQQVLRRAERVLRALEADLERLRLARLAPKILLELHHALVQHAQLRLALHQPLLAALQARVEASHRLL
mmetsp:Transcript_33183/g.84784  ORF Transcript_33183/g.84784 Transcript_33183/m.84784 type:complete len:246 (-) Transcript_33183:466-1203(-)